MVSHKLAVMLGVLAGSLASAASAALQFTGVNLSGAEFGSEVKPGTYGTNYIYPNAKEIDYYVGKGMNVFRLPFLWERLQRGLGQSLNTQELGRITTFVNAATSAGAHVILDPHNYGKYNGVYIGGAGGATDAQFADFWSRLATSFKGNDKVVFGLMNEPTQASTQWVSSANAAIAAIRTAGAGNQILVPGVRWTGAHSWYTSSTGNPSNAVAMLDIVDPGDNFVIEAHQYLDSDSSGTHEAVVSTTIGSQRLQSFTGWLRTNGLKGFLGEFAVPHSLVGSGGTQIGDEALENMLTYMESNEDVWTGWTWWAGGPWWNANYMFNLDPLNLGLSTEQDRAVMASLEPHLTPVPEPASLGLIGLGVLALGRGRRS